MPSIIDDSHFVPADRVPTGPIGFSLRAAYSAMAEGKAGGFVAQTGPSDPAAYVTAAFVRAALRVNAAEAGAAFAAAMPLHFPIGRFLGGDGAFRGRMIEAMDSGAVGIVPVLQPLRPNDAPPLRRNGNYAVYPVRDENRLAGWYFNHEIVAGTVQLPAPVYLCKDNHHRNPDSDSGYCSFCPSELIL
jgi:hypothetical protein